MNFARRLSRHLRGSPPGAAWLVALGLLAAGCATPGGSGPTAARDQVLVNYRGAADSMQRARFTEAKPLLDASLATLGGLSAGDRSARQARGYFREESRKAFRGEPYERVMAYYYRGILYWMDGEPDNARACFRSAQVQDADAEEARYQSDYVLLDYLDGYATAKLGGDGSDALRRARAVARSGTPPDFDREANVLVFYELGRGPTKYATGEYQEQLRFRAGSAGNVAVRIRVAGREVRAAAYDDLSFQATTRGGRVMDHVLANKAVFKSGTDTFGNAALLSGAILATQRGTGSAVDEVGLGLLAAGLIGKVVSAATTPRADTRAWDNLPNLLGFVPLRVPPGEHRLTVEFLNPADGVTLTRDATFTVAPGGRDVVLFFSDRAGPPAPPSASPPSANPTARPSP